MTSELPLVRLQNLGVRLQGQSILQNVSFDIQAGEIVTLIGPNGAGKTTLIRAVLGLQKPGSGSILRRPGLRIGYMPQKLHIDATLPLTVERFLTLSRQRAQPLDAVLDLTGIRSLRHKPVQSVSGGELQRVLLARTLLQKPELLVLDEPAQGVDINGQAELYQMIRQIRDDLGCAVLMVSHDLHLVMAATDRVICLNHHICCSGLPEHVSNDPAYRALFGRTTAAALAVYHHHHDHHHNLHGDVVDAADAPTSLKPLAAGHSHAGHGCDHDHGEAAHQHGRLAPAPRQQQQPKAISNTEDSAP